MVESVAILRNSLENSVKSASEPQGTSTECFSLNRPWGFSFGFDVNNVLRHDS